MILIVIQMFWLFAKVAMLSWCLILPCRSVNLLYLRSCPALTVVGRFSVKSKDHQSKSLTILLWGCYMWSPMLIWSSPTKPAELPLSVVLMSLPPALFPLRILFNPRFDACMRKDFLKTKEGHYPGAIRPLAEHVNDCWVLLCFHMLPPSCPNITPPTCLCE